MDCKSCDTCFYYAKAYRTMFCKRHQLYLCQLVAGCPNYISKDGGLNDEQVDLNRKREIEGYLGSLPK